MISLNIASGVILVLLGMRHLRKGLDLLFGNKLVGWLQKMTRNRLQGFLAGIVAGSLAPSSTAIAILSTQMLSRTALTAGPMLAVVLGANVGITVAVQLLSFRLEHYAGIFLVVGGIFYLYLKRPTFRGSGQILLALGFILLAMQLITGAAGVAQANPDLKLFFHVTENYPWAIFIATALLTVAVQSSTASIGLGIGLAYGGLLSDAAMLPWVLGATLGIAVTGMLAGWSSLEGRRLAVGNFIIKTAGALPLLLAGRSVSAWVFHFLPGTIAQQTANFNTLFNLSVGVLSLPLLGPAGAFAPLLV
jgi:phosphate:Na+ symporter